MKRLLKWLLPTLIFVEVALVWFGMLNLKEVAVIVGGIEVLIFLKLRMFYCLAKWILRKTKLGDGEFSYHKRSTLDMLILLVVLVTPVEVLVIEILLQAFLPWLWLRLLVLFLEVYALFWFLGFHASRVVLPHRLEEKGLRLRHGTFAEGFIPYSIIGCVERTRREAPRSGDGLTVDGRNAFLAIGGHTDVTLGLHAPRCLHSFLRTTNPVDTVHLAADEPEQFLEGLKERVAVMASVERQPG